MFKDEDDFKNIVSRLNIDDKPDADHRQNLHHKMLSTFDQTGKSTTTTWLTLRTITKLAAAAAIIIVAALAITFFQQSATPAYAIEQTIEAFKNVRYMHIVRHDEIGRVEDERWFEIGAGGKQVRCRQDSSPRNFLVVDDGKTTAVYHGDKNTIILYDRDEMQYVWFSNLGKLLQDLAGQGKPGTVEVESNVEYWGQLAHRVRLIGLNINFYIDPETKLPIAGAGYTISYENPPEGTFEIIIPQGVTVVDKRPGAEPAQEPQWMIDAERDDRVAQHNFDEARRTLAAGDYFKAVELFTRVVEIQPRRNWAWFWMGKTHYEMGQYDLAVWKFSKVIEFFHEARWSATYCYFARGLVYAKKGMKDAAKKDFSVALPVMIDALQHIQAAKLFDLADDPLRCADGFLDEGCHDEPGKEQSLAMMINRLRVITGQNFGYDPDASTQENEQAIATWEDWYENSGDIKFTPNAELVPIPPVLE